MQDRKRLTVGDGVATRRRPEALQKTQHLGCNVVAGAAACSESLCQRASLDQSYETLLGMTKIGYHQQTYIDAVPPQ